MLDSLKCSTSRRQSSDNEEVESAKFRRTDSFDIDVQHEVERLVDSPEIQEIPAHVRTAQEKFYCPVEQDAAKLVILRATTDTLRRRRQTGSHQSCSHAPDQRDGKCHAAAHSIWLAFTHGRRSSRISAVANTSSILQR